MIQFLRATSGRWALFAAAGDAYVPKDHVPYPTWNRLRGIGDPERTGADPHRNG